jgi:HlyD family secretion protein
MKLLILSLITKFNSLSKIIKIVSILILFFIIGLFGFKSVRPKEESPQYQTAQAEKGTLVISISGSGTISSGNSTKITTKASGTVKSVYVKNGDYVNKGDKIAELELDDYAKERQSSAYVAYLNAVKAVKTAQKSKTDADIAMWEARQAIMDAEQEQIDKNNGKPNPVTKEDYTDSQRTVVDKTVDQAHQAFNIAELQYKNADAEIINAQIKITAAWQDYQEASAIITAPSDGVINSLTLAPQVVIESTTVTNSNSSSSSSSNATVTSQKIGIINNPSTQFQATVNLTESDITKVATGQKTTLTLDAFPDKTFTGKVLAVDSAGTVNSGVTTYPVTVIFDPIEEAIYPNMAVEAQIITQIIDDVILVPSEALQTLNEQSVIGILKDGQVNQIQVETKGTNDTHTAISSGINEGDIVVTNTINRSSTTTNQGQSSGSVFGGMGNSRGAMMIRR